MVAIIGGQSVFGTVESELSGVDSIGTPSDDAAEVLRSFDVSLQIIESQNDIDHLSSGSRNQALGHGRSVVDDTHTHSTIVESESLNLHPVDLAPWLHHDSIGHCRSHSIFGFADPFSWSLTADGGCHCAQEKGAKRVFHESFEIHG